jgi:hypothetical protein
MQVAALGPSVEVLNGSTHLIDVIQDRPTEGRQSESLHQANKESLTQSAFKALDSSRDGCRINPQTLCGFPQAAGLDTAHEQPIVIPVHDDPKVLVLHFCSITMQAIRFSIVKI